MERMCLPNGERIILINTTGPRTYVIDDIAGRGAHCIAYAAHSAGDISRKVRIKECFPAEQGVTRMESGGLVWPSPALETQSKSLFKLAYEKQVRVQNDERFGNTFTHVVDDMCEANNTLYTVVDIDNGVTFAEDQTESLPEILKTVCALTKVIGMYHSQGYLYLDVKPENFLVLPETRDIIKLLDSDTIIKKDDLVSGLASAIPYTFGWAAPEQIQGKRRKISEKTDIYAIGAVLFWKLMDRYPENDDIGVFAEYEIPEYWTDAYDSRINAVLKRVFRKTIAASVNRRYDKTEELIQALEEAIKICSNEEYILPKESISDVFFVGRSGELQKLHELLQGEAKVVFLHGFGGIGKTELAKKYVQIHKDEYDVTVFDIYNDQKGLNQFVQDVAIKGYDEDDKEKKWKKLEKVCSKGTLFIIDNFDVDDDVDLMRLLSLNAKFLFTSRNDHTEICSDEIKQMELNAMSIDDLIPLFIHEYGRKITSEEDTFVRKIIGKFDNYTMMVPLIARQLHASDMPVAEFWEKIEDEGISGFGDDTEKVKHRKDGKITQETLLGHMNHLFNLSDLDEKYKCVLANLKAMDDHKKLTKSVYREYSKDNNLSMLNDLIDRGWIDKVYVYDYETDEDVMTMRLHPVVSELIEQTLNDKKYYMAIIKNTYEKLVKLNERPDDDELINSIGNYLRVYCDAAELDDESECIFEEMYRYIEYRYRNGFLDVKSIFFSANDFRSVASDQYFLPKLFAYADVKINPNIDAIPTALYIDRKSMELAVGLYNLYFYEIDFDYDVMKMCFLPICFALRSWYGLFVYDNDNNVDVERSPEAEEAIEAIEHLVGALTPCMMTNTVSDGKWSAYPRVSFSNVFDLTKWPEIADMYLMVAKISYLLYVINDSWGNCERRKRYFELYKGIISLLLYYQGVFVLPDSFSPEKADFYSLEWEREAEENGNINGVPYEIQKHGIVNLLYCSDRAQWRKNIGESVKRLIKTEHLSFDNYKTILNLDFLSRQPAAIRKALVKNSVFDVICSDEKIPEDLKRKLLLDFICGEIERGYTFGQKKNIFLQKPDICDLYYGCLEKVCDLVFAEAGTELTNERFRFYVALSKMITCNKRKNSVLVESIYKEIRIENVEHITQLIDLIKCVYNMGFHKIARSYYQKMIAMWNDRERVREMSFGIWINYILTLYSVAGRLKAFDACNEIIEEINQIAFHEWVEAIEDDEIDIRYKHGIIRECYWYILSGLASILIQEGYDAFLDSFMATILRANGSTLCQKLDESNLDKKVKNTWTRRFYEAVIETTGGIPHNRFLQKHGFEYYLRVYEKQDKFDAAGEFIAEKYILLAAIMYGKEKAKWILHNLEAELDEMLKKRIVDIIESYPIPE